MITLQSPPRQAIFGEIELPLSKSICNRVLMIRSIGKLEQEYPLQKLAEAEDTKTLAALLDDLKEGATHFNAGDAGTTFRFMVAYLSNLEGTWILDGSARMRQRPVAPLVEALVDLGAQIDYLGEPGFAPLRIIGKSLSNNKVVLPGHISSQFISALLMVAPLMTNGLSIQFSTPLTSVPYVTMTQKVMAEFGVMTKWLTDAANGKVMGIQVEGGQLYRIAVVNQNCISADWSAASYWYSFLALAKEGNLILHGLKNDGLQGDQMTCLLGELMGVRTERLNESTLRLSKFKPCTIEWGFDFSDNPDLFQTFAVCSAGLNLGFVGTGLHTLKDKESDRLQAVSTELGRLGKHSNLAPGVARFELGMDKIKLNQEAGTAVATYNDHRMAMSFAPLCMVLPIIRIANPEVVNKSYPNFWNDLASLHFTFL